MKIHILFQFRDGPWGGGNQFLKALRGRFQSMGCYAEEAKDADGILFNSNRSSIMQQTAEVYALAQHRPILVNRIDGPIFYRVPRDIDIDRMIGAFSCLFADGVIYQSDWIKKEMSHFGMPTERPHAVIMNSVDSTIFHPPAHRPPHEGKIRLIATSWSANMQKGFDFYRELDDKLDFDRYEMAFIGRSPLQFKNILTLDPAPSIDVANQLREADIFITASHNDPCSNSLVEALHCGLPAVVRDSGGHPEIIGKAGETFSNTEELMQSIEQVAANLDHYRAHIQVLSMDEIANQYFAIFERIASKKRPNKPLAMDYWRLRWAMRRYKWRKKWGNR